MNMPIWLELKSPQQATKWHRSHLQGTVDQGAVARANHGALPGNPGSMSQVQLNREEATPDKDC